MEIEITGADASALAADAGQVAVVLFSDTGLLGAVGVADAACGGPIARMLASESHKTRLGETTVFPYPAGLMATALVVVGGGREASLDAAGARKIGAAAAAAFGRPGGTIYTFDAFAKGELSALVCELALGAGLRSYRFERYRTAAGRDPEAPPEPVAGGVRIAVGDRGAVAAHWPPRQAVMNGVGFTRDLVNEPANELGTEEFANHLVEQLSPLGVEVEILGEAELEKLGMRTLLAVGQGSRRESRVGVMRWQGAGDDSKPPVALVGKGVVFDTGGISIKPAKGMEEMTMDMGGAGVVAGAMKALAQRQARSNVVGLVGLVENMPDGNAQRPGDVVLSMSGKTVEVLNTDAEGRLVLADLLHYVQTRFSPSAIVDLATLTGAMVVSLGEDNAGFFSNDEALAKNLLAVAREEGEGLWQMPLGKEYARLLRSRIADIAHISPKPWGGAITAAEFLHAFIRPGQAWAHIDIAGVTLRDSDQPLSPKGATGWGVRTLDRLVARHYEAS